MLTTNQQKELRANTLGNGFALFVASAVALAFAYARLSRAECVILTGALTAVQQTGFYVMNSLCLRLDQQQRHAWLDTLTDRLALQAIINNSRQGRDDIHAGVYEIATEQAAEDVQRLDRASLTGPKPSTLSSAMQAPIFVTIQVAVAFGISKLL